MKSVFVLFVLLALSGAAAQDTLYLGVRVAGATLLEEWVELVPYLGVQLGVRALELIELRAAYDVSLGVSYAHADLLYSQPLGDELRGYVGAGPDYYANGWNGERGYGAHGTAGIEYRTGIVGLFAEVQPIYGFDIGTFRLRSGFGVNFHF